MPCSGQKIVGGGQYAPTSNVVEILSLEDKERLLHARSQLANSLNLPDGPDISGNVPFENFTEYLPAYKRYAGKMYQRCNFKHTYPKLAGYKVLIISALYGVLEANDFIRNYDLQMIDNRPGTDKVWRFWEKNHLGRIVESIITKFHPSVIHDFLSVNYRKALSPWPPNNLAFQNFDYRQYDYPSLRMEALWRRGDDLKKLFE